MFPLIYLNYLAYFYWNLLRPNFNIKTDFVLLIIPKFWFLWPKRLVCNFSRGFGSYVENLSVTLRIRTSNAKLKKKQLNWKPSSFLKWVKKALHQGRSAPFPRFFYGLQGIHRQTSNAVSKYYIYMKDNILVKYIFL